MLNLIPVILRESSVQTRIDELVWFVKNAPKDSLIAASELCVSGYDFDGFFAGERAGLLGGAVGSFDAMLIERLQEALTPTKFLAFTHLTSQNAHAGMAGVSILSAAKPKIYNEFTLLSSTEMLHAQPKTRLFTPNREQEIFSAGDETRVAPFEFRGLNLGALVCFELRFAELWARLRGCDIVFVPAIWGAARADAYISLCKALAIANCCYVVASSALDLEFAGVFLPTGELVDQAKFDPNFITQIKANLGLS